jgi:hypothetical protein
VLHLYQVQGTFTPKLPDMSDTQTGRRRFGLDHHEHGAMLGFLRGCSIATAELMKRRLYHCIWQARSVVLNRSFFRQSLLTSCRAGMTRGEEQGTRCKACRAALSSLLLGGARARFWFLPEVWIADEATQALRRHVTWRNQIVRQCSRLKNIIQSIT